jgi:hypothetical protein
MSAFLLDTIVAHTQASLDCLIGKVPANENTKRNNNNNINNNTLHFRELYSFFSGYCHVMALYIGCYGSLFAITK